MPALACQGRYVRRARRRGSAGRQACYTVSAVVWVDAQMSEEVTPIDAQRRAEVLRRVEEYIVIAESHFGCPVPRVPVLFDLYGSTAGMFQYSGSERRIRFNPWIFAKYYRENLCDTVPHEVAHYVVHQIYGERGTKPHGAQWREVMAVFGAYPAVTFDRDLSGIPRRRQRRYLYRCECSVHELSSTRHNRVRRARAKYQCRNCGARLRPAQ